MSLPKPHSKHCCTLLGCEPTFSDTEATPPSDVFRRRVGYNLHRVVRHCFSQRREQLEDLTKIRFRDERFHRSKVLLRVNERSASAD
jgi:hypothetical protein